MNNDLISWSELLERLCEECNDAKKIRCGSPCCDYDLIKKAPAVDAEPVIRCKDCGLAETIGMGKSYVYCNHFGTTVFENDYCSYAEEKMDAEVSE